MRLDLSVLNDAQRRAVTHGVGPLLVLAGAGSGKTRVIIYRIAERIRRGAAPERILGITFTNKAAAEMRERLARMYPRLNPGPWLSTFHSLGHSLLRAEHEPAGLRRNFPIYDEADSRGVLTEEMRAIVGMSEAEKNLDAARRAISNWKNRFVSATDAVERAGDSAEYLQARIYARYAERLRGLGAVDFDDLIYLPVRLIEDNADVRARWTSRFDTVLVDEYQDTNTSQYSFARLLAGPREDLTVVGDDDQSIYAFRGAEIEKILSFRRDFPGAEIITLEENYRSFATILAAANAVISHNPHRHPKTLRSMRGAGEKIQFLELEDEDHEAEEVVGRAMDAGRRGIPYEEQAILLRSAMQARPFEEKLRFFNIPYTIIGARSFFDRREVRDVLAYARLLVFPEDDIAALRILNTPRRGFGEGSRDKVDQRARTQKQPVLAILAELDAIEGISGVARDGAAALLQAIAAARAALGQGALAALRQLLDAVNYTQALREMAADGVEYDLRQKSVASLYASLERYEREHGPGCLEQYLIGLTLATHTDRDDAAAQKQLTLLTFHGAKGLEFRRVALVGLEDDIIPHRRAVTEGGDSAIEEERRLFYVAITRARDELLMTRCLSRRKYGREVDAEESRFLLEIPEQLVSREALVRSKEAPVDPQVAAAYLAEMRARHEQQR
ncbi:MAG: ATP-dependent helicase [Planctomycetota bacterium]